MPSATLITASLDDAFSLSRLSFSMLAESENMGIARRRQWRAGRALLAEALSVFYGIDPLPELRISGRGKPFFDDPLLPHFSLSHSQNSLQLALCTAGETGCDVEVMRSRPRFLAIAREAFSPAENQWLLGHDEPQTAFWQLWCLREAWLKQQGGSVWQMSRIALEPASRHFTTSPPAGGRLWCAARDGRMTALALPAGVTHIEEHRFEPTSCTFILQRPRPWMGFSSS